MTASKALNHLAQEGHIVQKHGKGGFAASLAVHKHVSQIRARQGLIDNYNNVESLSIFQGLRPAGS